MKKPVFIEVRLSLLLVAFAFCALATAARANVTVYDNILSLATNGTKNYTFTDNASGLSATIAVTMSPYSTNATRSFSLLDQDSNGNFTRMGVDSATGGGDANWVDWYEGANFSASIVSASSSTASNELRFQIAGIGMRPNSTIPVSWTSSATATRYPAPASESLVSMDTGSSALAGTVYSGYLRGQFTSDISQFQFSDNGLQGLALAVMFAATNPSPASDPQLTSWLTAYAGRYARVYTNDLARTNGVSSTTWTNPVTPSMAQKLPTYAGVQEVNYSTDWIYIRTPDLAEYVMGPWYNDSTRTTSFLNWPTNQHVLFVLPRSSTLTNPPAAKTPTYGNVDAIGIFVNGVMMFDALDGYVWTGSAESMGGNGQWRRAAYPNEGPTLDTGNSHQQNTGEYHNHADPIALRYTLGDHVDFNPVTKIYTESTNPPTKHSPILGWVRDGYPIYGPFGYSNPSNSLSGIRRMVSGYQLRNGQNGSDNITNVGRATLPAWMLRNNGNTAATGPSVNSTYPAGRYLQDYAYLGDLTNAATGTNYQLGVDFDLNEYGGRWCVTPEFPQGTWVYFVPIDSSGVPVAPWNVGMYFYGTPTGFKGTNITETVVTNFVGVPNLTSTLKSPTAKNGAVTLAWTATEGGTYRVESTTNLVIWTTNSTSVLAASDSASYTNNTTDPQRFYRVAQTALAAYDPVTNSTTAAANTTLTMAPSSGNRNTTFSVTATISATATPTPPAQSGAPVSSFTVGTNSVSNPSYTYSGGVGSVTGTLTIPGSASPGLQTVTIIFSPPPGQQTGPSYTQANGFTIN